MNDRDSGKKATGMALGPVLAILGILVLWKNETRFDYYRAAARTTPLASIDAGRPGELVSHTGAMDQELTFPGEYVESFSGFLRVERKAEIYSWNKTTRKGRTDWNLGWHNQLEANERNRGLTQRLSSGTFFPGTYRVGDLPVSGGDIQLPDPANVIPPAQLKVVHKGLRSEGTHFYFSKFAENNLGNERVSYTGVPVPATATYFGRFQQGSGVADVSHLRTDWLSDLIRDSGILHHIVAGDRAKALATMRAHIARLRWVIRGAGTSAVMLGIALFFAPVVGWLFHIPLLGRVAAYSTNLLTVVLGLLLSFLTILAGYLASHPWFLVVILGLAIAGFLGSRKRGVKAQQAIKVVADARFGHNLSPHEIKELEFLEMAQLAYEDGILCEKEDRFLRDWARKQGWSDAKYTTLLAKVRIGQGKIDMGVPNQQRLENIVHLALADGMLSDFELKTIRAAAKQVGYDRAAIQAIIRQVQEAAASGAVPVA